MDKMYYRESTINPNLADRPIEIELAEKMFHELLGHELGVQNAAFRQIREMLIKERKKDLEDLKKQAEQIDQSIQDI
jgi:hypothetical protein